MNRIHCAIATLWVALLAALMSIAPASASAPPPGHEPLVHGYEIITPKGVRLCLSGYRLSHLTTGCNYHDDQQRWTAFADGSSTDITNEGECLSVLRNTFHYDVFTHDPCDNHFAHAWRRTKASQWVNIETGLCLTGYYSNGTGILQAEACNGSYLQKWLQTGPGY